MNRLTIKLESLILIFIGLGAGWFSLFGNYRLLMNPRFLYLTAGGAAIVLLIGLASFAFSQKRNNSFGLLVFGLFILLILFGRPHTMDKSGLDNPFGPVMDAPAAMNGDIPGMDLVNLYYAIREENIPEQNFVTTGIVKRLPSLEKAGQFALMKTVMVCCLADALALGVRVSYDHVRDLEDGDWVNVYGRVKKAGTPMKTPSFRMGPVMFTSVNEDYVIEPEKIAAYDSTLKLKTLLDILANDRLSIFAKAVKSAGLEKELVEKGPYTIAAPINEAFELWPAGVLEELLTQKKKNALREFVSCHIFKGRWVEKDMLELASLTTIKGRQLDINLKNGKVYIEKAKIIFGDNMARNGVVHMVYPNVFPDADFSVDCFTQTRCFAPG